MLTADAARRIAKAVQAYEQNRTNIKAKPLRTMSDDGGASIRLARVTEDWAKDTEADVQLIYERSCEDEGSGGSDGSGSGGETVTAWNRIFPIPAGATVEITEAVNGCWYVVAAGCGEEDLSGDESGSGCGCTAIAGHDLTTVEGYEAEATQILGHENGCLKWFDTTECSSGSGSS